MADTGRKRGILSYLNFAAALLALATIIAGLAAPGFAYSTFDTMLIIILAASIVVSVLSFFVPLGFLSLLAAALHGCAFGRTIFCAGPVIADKVNNISFQGGSFAMVVVYLTLTGIACVLMIVSCFLSEVK